MARFQISVPPHIADVLTHLSPTVKRDAKQALRILSEDPHAGEALEKELRGLWKYRIRSFRIVYRLIPGQRLIQVMGIGSRNTIYDTIRAALHVSTSPPRA